MYTVILGASWIKPNNQREQQKQYFLLRRRWRRESSPLPLWSLRSQHTAACERCYTIDRSLNTASGTSERIYYIFGILWLTSQDLHINPHGTGLPTWLYCHRYRSLSEPLSGPAEVLAQHVWAISFHTCDQVDTSNEKVQLFYCGE